MAAACPAILEFSSFASSTVVSHRNLPLNRGSLLPVGKQMVGMSVRPLVLKSAYLQPSPSALRAVPSDEALSNALTQLKETLEELKIKWDSLENKSIFGTYAAGAIIVFWISSSIMGAISPIPLLPKFLELVGFGYSTWFAYRYLLFKANREELSTKINTLKDRITGVMDDMES